MRESFILIGAGSAMFTRGLLADLIQRGEECDLALVDIAPEALAVAWGKTMRLKVDRESDALYFRLDESAIVESEEVSPGVILDFNKESRVVGVEMLDLNNRVAPDKLRVLEFEAA